MIYRIRYHPLVERDLDSITHWIMDRVGAEVARGKLTEIEQTITDLAHMPHRGSVRDDVAPGLRAVPAARRGVVAFTVDDAAAEVVIQAVTYGGTDWTRRIQSRARSADSLSSE